MGESDSRLAFGFPFSFSGGVAYLVVSIAFGVRPTSVSGFPLPWLIIRIPMLSQEPPGPPKFLAFLSAHAALFVDPGRPSESSPRRSLCVGFWYRYAIAACIILSIGAVSRLQGVRSPLRPMWFPGYASAVSFGLGPPPQLQPSVRVAG